MGSPIGRYERDLQRLRSKAIRSLWYDESAFELGFCTRTAIHQLMQMSCRQPTSVTELRAMLNEIGAIYARVTHSLTKNIRPGDEYTGPTSPHPRDLRQFILFDVIGAGLPILLADKRNRQAAQKSFEVHLKPLLQRAIEILTPLVERDKSNSKVAA